MHTNLEITELRAVCALANIKNFRSTAEELALSHSALSRLIGRIEAKIGTRLFDRDTRNVELTPHGRVFVSCAEEALANIDNSLAKYDDYVNFRRGRIAVAGLPSVTGLILPDIVEELSKKHPDIEVRILDGPNSGVIAAVERGDADIGFTESRFAANTTLRFQYLFEDSFVAVAPEGGPINSLEEVTWLDLLKYPLITMVRDTSIRRVIDSVYLQLGKTLRPSFEVSQLITAGALLEKGLGVSAMPELALRAMGREGLVSKPLRSPQTSREIGLVMRRSANTQPSVNSFLRLVNARFRQNPPDQFG